MITGLYIYTARVRAQVPSTETAKGGQSTVTRPRKQLPARPWAGYRLGRGYPSPAPSAAPRRGARIPRRGGSRDTGTVQAGRRPRTAAGAYPPCPAPQGSYRGTPTVRRSRQTRYNRGKTGAPGAVTTTTR